MSVPRGTGVVPLGGRGSAEPRGLGQGRLPNAVYHSSASSGTGWFHWGQAEPLTATCRQHRATMRHRGQRPAAVGTRGVTGRVTPAHRAVGASCPAHYLAVAGTPRCMTICCAHRCLPSCPDCRLPPRHSTSGWSTRTVWRSAPSSSTRRWRCSCSTLEAWWGYRSAGRARGRACRAATHRRRTYGTVANR